MNDLVQALRRHLRGLAQTAASLDELLGESGADIDVTTEQAARLLLRLQKLARRLEAIADELGASVDPLPPRVSDD
jgi:hypothetical protein